MTTTITPEQVQQRAAANAAAAAYQQLQHEGAERERIERAAFDARMATAHARLTALVNRLKVEAPPLYQARLQELLSDTPNLNKLLEIEREFVRIGDYMASEINAAAATMGQRDTRPLVAEVRQRAGLPANHHDGMPGVTGLARALGFALATDAIGVGFIGHPNLSGRFNIAN